MSYKILPITSLIHQVIKASFDQIDVACDMTLGQGFDAEFLADISRVVYAFDVQQMAIDQISNPMISCILGNHKDVDKYIKEEVDVFMFNLGYLPNSDKKIQTSSNDTILALDKCLKMLSSKGIITIVTYCGNQEQIDERNNVDKWCQCHDLVVLKLMMNIDNAPIGYVVSKR
ncbi:MAG: class I SAM-dependent methyltransferase [Erysipelotrichaceae bacterium]